ncbi:DUF5689 domain-containing protein [Bacteroidales bacterium OttesenSCG-928-C03]|nr:DUF5689 domain-containing protein [Bacteroidales bacterium OttesenSCG-928-C03]
MKHNTLSLIIIAIATLLLSSCNQKWDEPTFVAPKYNGKKATHSIAQIKEMHTIGSNQLDSLKSNKDIIVDAWVVSSDRGGNIYKTLYVQDETGALAIPINKTGLFNDFPVGQKVFIKCNGLVLGDYHNLFQMGWVYQGGIGQIHSEFVDNYISKDGLPDLSKAPFEITTIYSAADLSPDNQSKLVQIPDCEFDAASIGLPLAGNDVITEHTVSFNGTSIVVRTSNYAKFRSMTCPESKVTLVGILSLYNSTYQLLLRTREDIIIQDEQPDEELVKMMTFDENSLTTGGWSVSNDDSETKWTYNTSTQSMFHQPANAGQTCNDWLISPAITLSSTDGISLYLEHRNSIQGLPTFFQVYYSTTHTEDNFNESDWTAFSPNLTRFTADFDLSNALDASVIQNNNFRIAIRYNNSTGIAASRWYVKNIQFKK